MKRTYKKTRSIIIVLLFSTLLNAQQDPMISQYMFNGLFLNPGYAGSHDYSIASMLYRYQWAGIEGAPHTGFFSYDAPIRNVNVGIGGVLSFDRVGVTNKMDLVGNYAYHIRMGRSGKLSIGLRTSISYYWANTSDLRYWDSQDPVYQGDITGRVIPNFGLGLYYYGERFYVGVVAPQIISYDKNAFLGIDNDYFQRNTRHFYMNAGYVFHLGRFVDFRPSFLLKYTPEVNPEADLNVHFLFNKKFWVGASYRTLDGIVAMFEVNVTPDIRIGYAFDYPLHTWVRNYTYGTHEIMVAFDIGKPQLLRIKSPRYF
jgi:type IX secretion system PorP/SprF family membrane protein